MVPAIFDVPMAADGVGCDGGINELVRQIVAGLARSLPQAGVGLEDLDDPFNANDGGEGVPPFRCEMMAEASNTEAVRVSCRLRLCWSTD